MQIIDGQVWRLGLVQQPFPRALPIPRALPNSLIDHSGGSPAFCLFQLSVLDVNALRYTMGLVALAIASAGPIPLWLHHTLCHTHLGHLHSADGVGCHAHLHIAEAPVTDQPITDQPVADETAATCVANDRVCHHPQTSPLAPSGAQAIGSFEHECLVCYQLSQVSAPPMAFVPACFALPPVDSLAGVEPNFLATVVGLYAPRGPPMGLLGSRLA